MITNLRFDHILPRHQTKVIRCRICKLVQGCSNKCGTCLLSDANEEKTGCGQVFGLYYCSICRMWSNDTAVEMYHCEKCGICRRGKGLGIDYFHCDTCQCCLRMDMQNNHTCRSGALNQNCPLCQELLSTSVLPSTFGKHCGHSMHHHCFMEFLRHGNYKCPFCTQPMVDLKDLVFEKLSIRAQAHRYLRELLFAFRQVLQHRYLRASFGVAVAYSAYFLLFSLKLTSPSSNTAAAET